MEQKAAIPARIVSEMFAKDRAAQTMGIEILETGAGFSQIAFVVRADMLNSMGACHGGFLFALADTAFGYACNSRGQACVALHCSISFSAPGRAGARLVATARERSLGGRTGIYDVEVVDDAGSIVAFFRGTSYRLARDA